MSAVRSEVEELRDKISKLEVRIFFYTYRTYSGPIPVLFRAYSGPIPDLFRSYSGPKSSESMEKIAANSDHGLGLPSLEK
jgi:hypothetical protein